MTARPSIRRSLLAQIHIAKKQLGMEDDTYRAMLWTLARVKSSADAGDADLQRIVAHLKARGFNTSNEKRETSNEWDWVNRAPAFKRPMLWKIRRLVINKGIPDGKQKAYADGIASRMFNITKLEMCGKDELHDIISALNKDAQRHASKEPAR